VLPAAAQHEAGQRRVEALFPELEVLGGHRAAHHADLPVGLEHLQVDVVVAVQDVAALDDLDEAHDSSLSCP
jgi:hypothetical protein